MVTQIGTAGTFQWLGQTTDTVSFWLKRVGSNTGSIQAYQVNSGGTMSSSTTTLDSSTLTTSFVEYTFTFPSPITLSASTAVGVIRASGSGTLNVGQWLASQGGGLLDCDINQGWNSGAEGAGNLNMCIAGSTPSSGGTTMPPPPAWVKI